MSADTNINIGEASVEEQVVAQGVHGQQGDVTADDEVRDASVQEQAVAQVVHGPQDEEGKLDVQMLVLEFMLARELMLGDKKQDAVWPGVGR